MKNFNLLLVIVLIVSFSFLMTHQALGANAKGRVVIIPFLCKQHINHFDFILFGNKNGQTLVGTNGNDLIVGFENTKIFGKEGNDCLVGGNGNNVIVDGDDNDIVIGGTGQNIIFAGNGNDRIVGGPSNDIIFLGKGTSIIDGGTGTNYCIGKVGKNIIVNCIIINNSNTKENLNKFRDLLLDSISELHSNSDDDHTKHETPSWIKNDLMWWEDKQISDNDLLSALHYKFDSDKN